VPKEFAIVPVFAPSSGGFTVGLSGAF
jgi:hypothetical protein